MQERHCLSNINPEERTATCSVCGPVGVKRRTPKTPGGQYWYRCQSSYKTTPSELRDDKRRVERRKLRRHALTGAELDDLKIKQNFRCAICKRKVPLCIDHNHDTGETRGLLCDQCNLAIGLFKDSIENLRAAIEYLDQKTRNPGHLSWPGAPVAFVMCFPLHHDHKVGGSRTLILVSQGHAVSLTVHRV